jgi:hypothetical protein
MRFASIIISILFVLVVIIALLNMLVTLAVMGGEGLRQYGQTYHSCNQVQLLYEWHKALRGLTEFVTHNLTSRSALRLRHDKRWGSSHVYEIRNQFLGQSWKLKEGT